MTIAATMLPETNMTWRNDAALGLAGALFALCLHAVGHFPTLPVPAGDNDSMLRLVEIRDLIGGQGWFDLHQYRMGPQGGFVMHWSRLVDAPIAVMILVASAFTAKLAAAETAALLVWPTLLMAAALAFTLRIARAVGGDWALLPALIICTTALHFGGPFAPGDIDHHNVQLMLTLAAMTALIIGRSHIAGFAAGAACALMLAVGMETLPYVAVAGLIVSIGYLLGGQAGAAKAAGFGIGFAGVGLAAFLATVPASAWLASQCDAYSFPQFSVAMLSGFGLAAAAVSPAPRRSFVGRLAALLALGFAVAVFATIAFPQCLAHPVPEMGPRLQSYFLDNVIENQSFWSVITQDWAKAVRFYLTPVLALIVLGIRLRKGGTAAEWTLMAFLIGAFAVSVWLVRGTIFSIPFAAIALAAWVGEWRQRIRVKADRLSMLRFAVAWLVSLNFAWAIAAYAASAALGERAAAPAAQSECERRADYTLLAAQPPTTVLAISNLGAPILVSTAHRVLAAPYHRNITGNLLTFDAFMGTAEQARTVIDENWIGLVAICRGNGETQLLTKLAPGGFLAALIRDDAPNWLEKMPQAAGAPLEIYRVRPQR
ncbi:GtrA family protein [Bradyrhizobium genosp. P]|uniref:GtrA family protein n=1 Tax=Bradyrhizobium genosp. P TaxID=83641 RepID=UPI003CFA3013